MVTQAIKQAEEAHRRALEATYEGVCTIYGMWHIKDPETKVTRQEETIRQERIPCHLSFSSYGPAADGDTYSAVSQTIKLFLSPEIPIPPGSRIEVTQQGRTESYNQSGKAAVYSSHQEIVLELWGGYA